MMASAKWGLLCAAAATLFCTACGDGSDRYISGNVSLRKARVCLDLDGNFACGEEEPFTISDSQGNYSIFVPDLGAGWKAVVAEAKRGETLSADNRPSLSSYSLVSTLGRKNVSIWTTMAAALVEEGTAPDRDAAIALVRTGFGLPADFDFHSGPGGGSETRQTASLAEHTYGLLAEKYSTESEAKAAAVKAGAETCSTAEKILAIAERHRLISAQPPPSNSPPVEVGIFHGDYNAIPITTNMAYGIGLDESNFGLKGLCVGTDYTAFPGLCSNVYNYAFELVESVDEVAKHMSIGASAKAGVSVAGFDVVSVSGGFDYLKDTDFKDNAIYILFREERKLCGYPVAPVLLPVRQAEFISDYEQFRAACGDRYLSSIVTGGYFMGLIEVDVDVDSSIEEMRLKLSGKVMGITVFNKTWRDTMRDIESTYSCRTRVLSNAFQYSNNTLNMSGVFAKYDEYLAKMAAADCSGDGPLKSCGYLASFAPYETISAAPPGNAARIRTNTDNMHAFESYYFETADLLADYDNILLKPDDYNIGNDVDAFNMPNSWTRSLLVEWRGKILGYQNSAVDKWQACYDDIMSCTADPVDLGLPLWINLKGMMPTRKFIFPEDCEKLSEEFGVTEDGEYWLYLGGDAFKEYRAYCKDMATSSPKSYLVLENTSSNTESPVYNYSSYVKGSSGTIMRTFEALQVEPGDTNSTVPYLKVVSGQKDFTAYAIAEPFPEGADSAWAAQNLAVLVANAQDSATAKANLNLEGTRFILSTDLSITGDATCSPLTVTVSADRKNIDIFATGAPLCKTAAANLRLVGAP
jgi:hypothetical protein